MKRKRKSSRKSHFHNAKKAKEANSESGYNHGYAFIQSSELKDWYEGASKQALKAPNLF